LAGGLAGGVVEELSASVDEEEEVACFALELGEDIGFSDALSLTSDRISVFIAFTRSASFFISSVACG
jgi:hypothetical protein